MDLDYEGLLNLAKQQAKEQAALLYPEGPMRDRKEKELAALYYRAMTIPPSLHRGS